MPVGSSSAPGFKKEHLCPKAMVTGVPKSHYHPPERPPQAQH